MMTALCLLKFSLHIKCKTAFLCSKTLLFQCTSVLAENLCFRLKSLYVISHSDSWSTLLYLWYSIKLGMLNNNRIMDYHNLFSFSFLHYRFSKWACEYCIGCSRKCGAAHVNWPAQTQCTHLFTSIVGHNECLQDCLPITSQQLSHATHHYQQRTRKTAISHASFHPCKAVVGRPSEIWSSLT